MGKFYDAIPPNLVKWIDAQQMFWVASAPLRGDGHVNVSPKGLRGTFHVEHANRVWYEDFTGSGSETMAHLREPGNGRITIMLCAFDGAPRIMRLWGRGTVYEFGTPEYEALLPLETRRPGSRSAVVVDVHKVGTSCGFAVPLYTFKAHRPMLLDFGAKLEENELKAAAGTEEKAGGVGLKAYWVKENLQSLDGLPAMRAAHLSEVMPRHIPANGEWGKGARDGGVDADGSEVASVRKNTNEEMVRLVLAFSMGIAVAAVYVKVSGMA
ncbi:hypothetical protein POSPLADRAFT_1129625 [Postia placenta MAD-698-R-SB12]|uniref:Uncharacterized protein n=1 Tax=Postia placenta MAD-698-R-SB12 TaxID=670580 RepID=A0A1X6NHW9_9APHY|nr:hypothetical protein POSPLADRAFT_1129625 [Postia placenta MAD-698-R-SB12]OSX68132.1 hypothetical protein POSPLADRAFT_1129625 [Postia placenta MAD-698-R-SB12]